MVLRWEQEKTAVALVCMGTTIQACDSSCFWLEVRGSRLANTLKKLLALLKPYEFAYYCTDGLETYATHLPEEKHIVEKFFTQRIERQ